MLMGELDGNRVDVQRTNNGITTLALRTGIKGCVGMGGGGWNPVLCTFAPHLRYDAATWMDIGEK